MAWRACRQEPRRRHGSTFLRRTACSRSISGSCWSAGPAASCRRRATASSRRKRRASRSRSSTSRAPTPDRAAADRGRRRFRAVPLRRLSVGAGHELRRDGRGQGAEEAARRATNFGRATTRTGALLCLGLERLSPVTRGIGFRPISSALGPQADDPRWSAPALPILFWTNRCCRPLRP